MNKKRIGKCLLQVEPYPTCDPISTVLCTDLVNEGVTTGAMNEKRKPLVLLSVFCWRCLCCQLIFHQCCVFFLVCDFVPVLLNDILPGYQLLQLSLDIDTVDILMFSVKRKTRIVKNIYSKIVTQQFKHPRCRNFKRSHDNIDNDDAPLYQVPCHQPRLDMMYWYTICAEKNNKQKECL